MPAIHRFVVTQERQTEVTAESPSEAIAKATKVFQEGMISDQPNVIETSINAELA